jgi:hypothetical protein
LNKGLLVGLVCWAACPATVGLGHFEDRVNSAIWQFFK